MNNKTWLCIALITFIAGYAVHYKVERVVAPVNIAGVFK